MKTAIIFDLDGTLWDACQAMADAWNVCVNLRYPQIGLHLTYDDLHGACGMTMDAFSDMLLGNTRGILPEPFEQSKRELAKECWRFETKYMKTHGGVIFPGVPETIAALHKEGYPLYIVSNCQKGYIENFIAQSAVEAYISDTENFEHTGLEKWQNIQLLMERNGLRQAVYVGDTQGDCESAKKAGIPFIHAAYGFGTVSECDGRIDDVTELVKVCKRLF